MAFDQSENYQASAMLYRVDWWTLRRVTEQNKKSAFTLSPILNVLYGISLTLSGI